MAEELSLDSIKDMKKAEYIKAFKNKAAWKKAKAVIFLVDYKLEGKKAVIAIPFKKENEMKLEMKRLKKEKLHLLKKSGGGEVSISKGSDGLAELNVKLTIGGLKPELLILKATPLLEKIKLRIKATIEGEALLDAASKEVEVDINENLPEDNMEDVAVDESSNEVYEKDSVEAESEPEKPEVANVSDAIKQTLAKIAKFNKLINLKDGLQETDINNAEALKAAIKDFAAQLKTASAEIRNEFGETFLKTKKIYAKLEEELNRLKNQGNDLDAALNDTLGVSNENASTAPKYEMPAEKKQAIENNKKLMSEINELIKSVDLYTLA
jgi:hypothetical protein